MTPIDKARAQGPCLICGIPGASSRHRLWDLIYDGLTVDRMSPIAAARRWRVPVDEVRWVRREFARAKRQHRVLPGRRVFEGGR